MQDTWQAFLIDQGATIQDNGVIEFDNANIKLSKSPIVSPLSGFTVLAIGGNDRHAFLHSQFINDLNLIEKPAAQLSAWCNPKGQVITNFFIINTGISYLLIFKQDLTAFVQKRLGMFVLRSEVTIDNISESSPLVGIANLKNLSSLSPNVPTNPGEVIAHQGLIIICYPDNSGRYLIIGSNEALIKKISELKESFTITGSSTWNLLDILAGHPWITSVTQEQFLPQMLNLDALKGLSYQKGCYPGQEVIARLHYRGEVKKRLHLIKAEQALIAGNVIHLQDTDKKVGIIINAEPHPDGSSYALAVIELEKVNEKLFSDNHQITLQELPYAVEP